MKDLKSGKSVRSHEIQKLADDLKNASLVLNQIGTINEVNTQSVLIEIVSRLPNFAQLKWRKHALEHKRVHDKYPDFSKLVSFMATLAGECSDPVYGNFLPRRDKPKPKPSPTSNFPATSFAANASPEAGNSNGTRAKSGFSVPGVGQHSSDRSRAYARPEAPMCFVQSTTPPVALC